MSTLVGKEIHGYRITQIIGKGGMGEVYHATHLKTNRPVAIKLLIHERGIDRFRNEARLQANVNHPNIARLYDLIEIEHRPALIIEYIDGLDLDIYLEKNPMLSVQSKLHLFQQITAAIAHLHQLSVTHRDIKPSNIKVQKDGVVKLIDFGIAKGVTSPTITASGQTIGTLDYMSPERLDGRYTVQSDIWSLGVLLYEMITGKNPFKAKDEFTMRKSISKGEYVRIENFPQISESDVKVGGIITKCLQINPAKRFRDGKELHDAVNRFIRHGSLVRVSRPVFNNFPATGKIALALGGVAILALIIILLTTGNDGTPPTRDKRTESSVATTQVELVITTNTTGPAAVILPDGKRCPTPCTLTREQGTEIKVEIVAEGFKPYSASLQFRKNDRKTFTLRRID